MVRTTQDGVQKKHSRLNSQAMKTQHIITILSMCCTILEKSCRYNVQVTNFMC